MRHAKSDQRLLEGNDFDRTLNERGQNEPPIIAKQLNSLGITVEKALVSSARRTRETWTLLLKNLSHPPEAIFEDRLYNAFYEDVIDVLKEYAAISSRLLVVAHNPAIPEVCEYLSGENCDFKPASLAILSTSGNLAQSLKKPKQFSLEKMLVV